MKAELNKKRYFLTSGYKKKLYYPLFVYPAEWQGIKIFAHRPILDNEKYGVGYQVTDAATGMMISSAWDYYDKPEDALKETYRRMDKRGLAEYLKYQAVGLEILEKELLLARGETRK